MISYALLERKKIMYYELNKKEIKKFIKKYLNPNEEHVNKINSITCIEYDKLSVFVINKKYTIKIYKQ